MRWPDTIQYCLDGKTARDRWLRWTYLPVIYFWEWPRNWINNVNHSQELNVKAAEKLAQALHDEGLLDMEAKARTGYYGDFTSPLAMPINQLVQDLRAKGALKLADRAMDGEFDGE
jgi:hypothetical protein